MLPLIVKVAVEQAEFHYDKLYGYTWPARLGEPVAGIRVLVPFGGGNRKRQAVVLEVCSQTEREKLKPVYSRLDDAPLYTKELLELALWMKERFFCTAYDALRAMIPPGLYMQIKPSYQVAASLLDKKCSAAEEEIVQAVTRCPDGAEIDYLQSLFPEEENLVARLDAMVKKGLLVRIDEADQRSKTPTVRMVRPLLTAEELAAFPAAEKLTAKQKKVMAVLWECGCASQKELCRYASVTPSVITHLQQKALVEFYERENLRSPVRSSQQEAPAAPISLNEEQQQAYSTLRGLLDRRAPAAALLYGVTGSGKTQVYMQLIDSVLAEQRQVLVLVPEISLTPQSIALFSRRFGDRVAVLHSGLSMGERTDEWTRIRRGEADVVVGTRSAVFAPLDRLGLVVIDEEQEHTYKSENAPRYHARDIARFRCMQHQALLLLASATPSMETYHLALKGTYTLCRLTSRYGKASLPKVTTVDMRQETDERLVISPTLQQAMEERLQAGEQIILLLNRRGYHTFVACHTCGSVIMCPSCSISLTYHMASEQLVCHYCGYTTAPPRSCPSCGAKKIRYSGYGTQRVEQAVQETFPQARLLRMDADTTVSRYSYEERFSAFARGEYDIMIGTQMVAKGLDFPKVGLVGVLSADQSLYNDDFRAYETAFSLLTQAIGRAGRRDAASKAVIQTYTPENPVIELAAKQDFDGFYQMEINARKLMHYPPYSSLYQFGFSGQQEQAVSQAAVAFLAALKRKVTGTGFPMIALDIAPATIARLSGKYRYKLLVKTRNTVETRRLTAELLCEFSRDRTYRNVSVWVDVDPAVMM